MQRRWDRQASRRTKQAGVQVYVRAGVRSKASWPSPTRITAGKEICYPKKKKRRQVRMWIAIHREQGRKRKKGIYAGAFGVAREVTIVLVHDSNSCKLQSFATCTWKAPRIRVFVSLARYTVEYGMVAWHDTEDKDAELQVHRKIDGNWQDAKLIKMDCVRQGATYA